MSRLVVFGDSFATGYWGWSKESHLSSDGWNKPFCEFLAEDLSVDVLNLGMPGASNLAIMNDFLHYLKFSRKDGDRLLFVWTDAIRGTSLREEPEKLSYVDTHHLWRFTGVRHDREQQKRLWRNDLEREGDDKLDCAEDYHFKIMMSTSAYRTVKSFCEELNLPYRMTNSVSDSVLLDKYYLSVREDKKISEGNYEYKTTIHSVGIVPMMEKDNPNWIEGLHKYNTLVDICVDNWLSDKKHKPLTDKYLTTIQKDWKKYPLLTHCVHPNQKGHMKIAEVLFPYIKELMDE